MNWTRLTFGIVIDDVVFNDLMDKVRNEAEDFYRTMDEMDDLENGIIETRFVDEPIPQLLLTHEKEDGKEQGS